MDWLLILAQTADAAPASGAGNVVSVMLGAAGGVVFAIWLGWYTTTTTIPNMQRDHREERKAADEANRKMIENLILSNTTTTTALINRFDGTLKEYREEQRKDLQLAWDEVKAEREARQADTTKITEALSRIMKG